MRTAGSASVVIARDEFEREREQRVAGENRGRLVESAVHGRPAAPQLVVVHGRQIVMHQRIAVHALDRRRRAHRLGFRNAEQRRALDHEERPEPLAAAERCVPHGEQETLGPRDLARERRGRQRRHKRGLGRGRDRFETALKRFFRQR